MVKDSLEPSASTFGNQAKHLRNVYLIFPAFPFNLSLNLGWWAGTPNQHSLGFPGAVNINKVSLGMWGKITFWLCPGDPKGILVMKGMY
jgi:hypothetical protein